MTAIRLQRFLSQAGVAARRKAEILIQQGAVKVNGKVVTKMGVKVDPKVDRVTVDGQAVYPEDPFYALLNKPKGCITTVSDPQGRMTVMDYLRKVPATVSPVGRLDFYSEGVLLLTNDGELAARLLSSRQHVEKTYHVKVRGQVTDIDIQAMRDGVRIDARTRTKPAQVDRLRSQSRHDWLIITLIEGKSRQIHRMVEVLGYTVLKLQRVAFGGLTFHGLRVGDARELTQLEVNELRNGVGLPKNTVSRGKWRCQREDTELSRRAKIRSQERAEEQARGGARSGGDRRPTSGDRGQRRPGDPPGRTQDRRGGQRDGRPTRAGGGGPRDTNRNSGRRDGRPGDRRSGPGGQGGRRSGPGRPGDRRAGPGRPGDRRAGPGRPGDRRPGAGRPGDRRPGPGGPGGQGGRRGGAGGQGGRRSGPGGPGGPGGQGGRRSGPGGQRSGPGKPGGRRSAGGKPSSRRFDGRKGGRKPPSR